MITVETIGFINGGQLINVLRGAASESRLIIFCHSGPAFDTNGEPRAFIRLTYSVSDYMAAHDLAARLEPLKVPILIQSTELA